MELINRYSVIIPCFNDVEHVKRAVDSCLNQSFPIHEIIVVDDASGAATTIALRQLEAEWQTHNVRVIFNKINGGPSVARNIGMKAANGDYICFLDSDDTWHPRKVEIIDSFLRKKPNCIVAHDYTYNFSDLVHDIKQTDLAVSKISFIKLLVRNPITTPSLVIPRDGKFYFDESMSYVEDHDLILRLARIYPIYFINAKLTWLNRPMGTVGGLSGNRWKMRKGELKMFYNLARRVPIFLPLLPVLWSYSLLKHFRARIMK